MVESQILNRDPQTFWALTFAVYTDDCCLALQKHERPAEARGGSIAGRPLGRGSSLGDLTLPSLSEQELLILKQNPQSSQTHDNISFWLERVCTAPCSSRPICALEASGAEALCRPLQLLPS